VADHDQHDRTEQPTAKRLQKAREQGQLPRSPELTTAAVLLIAGGALRLLGAHLAGELHGLMRAGLTLTREQALDESLALDSLGRLTLHAGLACAPLFGLTLLAALASPLILGGWNLSPAVLVPNFARLNPATGFGRMLSARAWVDLGKAFAKFLVVAAVAVWVLWQKSPQIMGLAAESTRAGIAHASALAGYALLMLAGSVGLIAAVDVPWQLRQHTQRLRMTREEVREELRESETAPEIRGRVRRVQRELARRRMMQEVPKADVVVVNPTHFAVALRYDEQRMRAPVVVAKGAELIAARIREIALEHRVPIFEAPPLARALHRHVEIGDAIPASLYVAVAQVLTYVYRLRSARRDGTPPPPPALDPLPESDSPTH
jgi:flagellar biosynthesis protein FlhB